MWSTAISCCDCWRIYWTTPSSTPRQAVRSAWRQAPPTGSSTSPSGTRDREFQAPIAKESSRSTFSWRTARPAWPAPVVAWVWCSAGWPPRRMAAASGWRTTPPGALRSRSGCGAAGSFLLQLFDRSRPVVLEKFREHPIREQLAAGLAARAVVCFVFGVDDPLDRGSANGTGTSELSVHGHLVPKCRDLLRKLFPGFLAKALRPVGEGLAGCQVQPLPLIGA